MDAKIKLREGLYFYQIDDKVYLRNVDTCEDFLFDGIAYDILYILYRDGGATPDDIVCEISREYDVPTGTVAEDILPFIDELAQKGLLILPVEPCEERVAIADEVLGKCMELGQLFSASLELTYRCNERCVHCYVDSTACDKARELSTAEWKGIISQLTELGCVKLLLTGGEVLLRDDFLEITEFAVKNGMLVDIFTNGYLLTPEILDELIKLKINSLSFSLYGGTADVHDSITGVKGSFDRTLSAVMMTKCSGIDTYIKTVVMPQNVDSMEALIKLGKRLRIDVTPGFTVLDTHDFKENNAYRILDMPMMEKVMGLFYEYMPSTFNKGRRSPDDSVCSVGKSSLHIDPYGEIRPCVAVPIPLGNIREVTVRDIWENSEKLKELRGLVIKDVCEKSTDCPYIDKCSLCVGRCTKKDGTLSMSEDYCIQSEALFNIITKK